MPVVGAAEGALDAEGAGADGAGVAVGVPPSMNVGSARSSTVTLSQDPGRACSSSTFHSPPGRMKVRRAETTRRASVVVVHDTRLNPAETRQMAMAARLPCTATALH